jgi:methylenetetrahydrofolate reductase (NADPH)
MGGRSIACINSRDRNLLGFRRDLLTAAAYGVSQFLFVYGDKPGSGGRTSDLTVRSMIGEARTCTASDPAFAGVPAWRIGVAAGLQPLPRWKHAADFIFSQVSYSADAQLRWRDANPAGVPVYGGVMVLASAAMARRHPRHRDPRLARRQGRPRQDGRRRGRMPADRPAPRQRRL